MRILIAGLAMTALLSACEVKSERTVQTPAPAATTATTVPAGTTTVTTPAAPATTTTVYTR
jgi:hypothetical protein